MPHSTTPRIPLSTVSTLHAAEADVAHAGVDHLRPPRGGAIAQAIAVRAQERAALDDFAWDLELRLRRVVAAGFAARVTLAGAGEPVARPLPHVAAHVEQSVAVGREGPDVGGASITRVWAPGELAVPVVRQ